MHVSEIMQRHPAVVLSTDTLQTAQQSMRWSEVRHLPVLHPTTRGLVGLITERDVLRTLAGSPDTTLTLRRPVSDFMSAPVTTVRADAELRDAAALLSAEQIGCVVVTDHGRIAGLVTTGDVLSVLAQWPVARRNDRARDPSVASVMYPEPIAVSPHAMLVATACRMAQRGVRHACVVDGRGRVLGIISDRDVRRVLGHPDRAVAPSYVPHELEDLRVEQIMTVPKTIREDAPVSEALSLLLANSIGALPVTDATGKLHGIVSYVDLLRHLRELLAIAS